MLVLVHLLTFFIYFVLDFYGKNNKESTQIDQIVDTLGDLMQCFRQAFLEKDETKKVLVSYER